MITRREMLGGGLGLAAIIASGKAPAALMKGIGARTAAWSGGGGWVNPYVTDGLVAMWDGEWNAGGGQHDPSTSIVKDLVGSFDLVHIGSPEYAVEEKRIYGALSNSDFTFYKDRLDQGNSLTLEFVMQFVSWAGAYVFSCYNTVSNGLYCNSSRKLDTLGARGSSTSLTDVVDTVYDKFTLSLVYDGNSGLAYSYGTYKKPFSVGSGVISRYGLSIGRTMGSYMWNYNSRVYNRALSAQEIAANFAVDQARFGIT